MQSPISRQRQLAAEYNDVGDVYYYISKPVLLDSLSYHYIIRSRAQVIRRYERVYIYPY
jgi:hypothetical protein